MAIYIARNKKIKLHYFIRIVRREHANSIPEDELIPLLNSLTTAKRDKQLVKAIEGAPLLTGLSRGEAQPKRLMTPSECAEALDSVFCAVDPETLAEEMFLFCPREIQANNNLASPASAFDAYAGGLREELEGVNPSRHCVIVEPVQDWMMLRGTLSIAAALLANIENPPEDGKTLEAVGFVRPDKNPFGVDVMLAPVKFDAWLWGMNAFGNLGNLGGSASNLDYLYRISECGEKVKRDNRITTFAVGGERNVFFFREFIAESTHFSALDVLKPPFQRNRNCCICVEDSGDQDAMARSVVRALWNTARDLRGLDDEPLGEEVAPGDIFDPYSERVEVEFHSLVARLWDALVYHRGRMLVACGYCGCGSLSSGRRANRVYCSNSCRTRAQSDRSR